jgi:uridine kinase
MNFKYFAALLVLPIYWLYQQSMFHPKLSTKPGMIVLLNGTSSAGKTSIVQELQKIYGDSYECIIGDEFIKTYEISHPKSESITNDMYQVQVISAMCKDAKQIALQGKNVFIELVQFDENYKNYCSILECEKIIKILVYCPLDILVDRLAKRNQAAELKVDLLTPLQLFTAIYKLQESETEPVVDQIKTNRMKYALQAATQEINKQIQEAGLQISFEQDPFCKNFIKQFKLDGVKEIVIVPQHHWDLIVNTAINSPAEIAKIIETKIRTQTQEETRPLN